MNKELREKTLNKLELLGAYADDKDVDELITLILDEAIDAVHESFKFSESAMRNRYDAVKAIENLRGRDE